MSNFKNEIRQEDKWNFIILRGKCNQDEKIDVAWKRADYPLQELWRSKSQKVKSTEIA